MGATNAYQCDGPNCTELVEKLPGQRIPLNWPRASVHRPGVTAQQSGSFHDIACLHAWIDQQVGTTPRVDKTPTGPIAGAEQ